MSDKPSISRLCSMWMRSRSSPISSRARRNASPMPMIWSVGSMPVFLHRQVGNSEALGRRLAHRAEHGLVLGLDGDEVLAARLVELGSALQRQVVGLCRS